MTAPSHARATGRFQRGMTVIELTLTLALMLGLIGVVTVSLSGIGDWRKGRNAGIELQTVYLAQKAYLADHPTESIADVTVDDLLPYMPNDAAAMPVIECLDDTNRSVDFNVMPPVVGSGTAPYDPSGDSEDSLWDVGGA